MLTNQIISWELEIANDFSVLERLVLKRVLFLAGLQKNLKFGIFENVQFLLEIEDCFIVFLYVFPCFMGPAACY